jgi:hypothetical protein
LPRLLEDAWMIQFGGGAVHEIAKLIRRHAPKQLALAALRPDLPSRLNRMRPRVYRMTTLKNMQWLDDRSM